MKLFEKCLIACDIDGTLMVNGVIPEINKEKIRFFMENGGDFAIATGRSLCAVSDVTAQLGEATLGTYANGTVIYERARNQFLFDATLNDTEYDIMFKIIENFPDVGIEIHYQDNVGVFRGNEETYLHIKYESMQTVDLQIDDLKSIKPNKILYLFPSHEQQIKAKAFADGFETESDYVKTTVGYYGKQRFFIEQIPKGVSKATGVKKLAEILGAKKGCVYAIGDYYNDVEMLTAADISAVPKDSPEDVKKLANHITTSAENGAVADFIDYLTTLRRK